MEVIGKIPRGEYKVGDLVDLLSNDFYEDIISRVEECRESLGVDFSVILELDGGFHLVIFSTDSLDYEVIKPNGMEIPISTESGVIGILQVDEGSVPDAIIFDHEVIVCIDKDSIRIGNLEIYCYEND